LKEEKTIQPALYFPGLNGVRFFAALLVILSHAVVICSHAGYPEGWSNVFSTHLGAAGVTIFFALSGFLITSLLLKEKKMTASVSVRSFYLRRILRIWPLYYLFFAISFFLLPEIPFFDTEHSDWRETAPYWTEFLLYIFMLPNVAFGWFTLIPYSHILWSIGVEEQFYLFWPHVVRKTSVPRLFRIMLILMAGWMLLKIAFAAINYLQESSQGLHEVVHFLGRTRFACMLAGGCFAWLLFTKAGVIRFLFHKSVQWLSLMLLTAFVMYEDGVPIFDQELIALFAGILILNIAANPRTIFRLNSSLLNFSGRISYGLYIWHVPVLIACLRLSQKFIPPDAPNAWLATWLVFGLGLVLTMGVATLSWYGYERFFLRAKGKYSVVLSGDDAQKS
jgi:peptidoglycan/LPS O-acetylase OafA/YrhL